MIVVADNSGRLCNRLLLFAHACATAIESEQAFHHLMAADIMHFAKLDPKLLEGFRVSCCQRIPGLEFILRCRQAFYERVRPFDVDKYKIGNENRVKLMSRHQSPLHILWCWWYRDPKSLIKQRVNICRILAPQDKYVIAPRAFAERVKNDAAYLVGVHVRRGDYREFREGRYFLR